MIIYLNHSLNKLRMELTNSLHINEVLLKYHINFIYLNITLLSLLILLNFLIIIYTNKVSSKRFQNIEELLQGNNINFSKLNNGKKMVGS